MNQSQRLVKIGMRISIKYKEYQIKIRIIIESFLTKLYNTFWRRPTLTTHFYLSRCQTQVSDQ